MGLFQDPQFWSGLKSTIRAFIAKLRTVGSHITAVNIYKILVPYTVVPALFLMPVMAEASIFSFISGLFTSGHVQAEEVEQNSQNIALLQATNSPDQGSASSSDKIVIVGGTSLAPEPQAGLDVKNSSDDQISIYVVHQGDTLPAIAKMFGVSVNTIKWANDLSGNSVKVGQTLVILPISGIQHMVKSGDTLQSIAKQHKGDLEEILQYNNLSKNDKLSVGETIFVPDGEAVAINTPKVTVSVGKTSSTPVYDGYFMRPVIGGIKTQGIHGHNGVDLASSYGSNIIAAADGTVIISRNSGWNGGYGKYIVIKHSNGTQTLYGHLSATQVDVGETVTQGQVIGKMGNSGQVTGPTGIHLHFEIRGARNPF